MFPASSSGSQVPFHMMPCEERFVRASRSPSVAHQACNTAHDNHEPPVPSPNQQRSSACRALQLSARTRACCHTKRSRCRRTLESMAASLPCTLAAAHSLAPRRLTPAGLRAAPGAPAARRCVEARCARARGVVASATKGDSASGGSSKPDLDDWISRWKERKSSGSAAPPPRSAEESFTGPDPRTGYCYVFAGGLSKEACAFNALILRDALEPRGVLLHATQLLPPNGSPWTLRHVALSQPARHARQLTRTRASAAALCVLLRSRSRPWPATCRCASSAPPRARWCVRCTRSATRRPWTRSS